MRRNGRFFAMVCDCCRVESTCTCVDLSNVALSSSFGAPHPHCGARRRLLREAWLASRCLDVRNVVASNAITNRDKVVVGIKHVVICLCHFEQSFRQPTGTFWSKDGKSW